MPKKKNNKLRLAILWHMHQPHYKNPFNGKLELPWVRVHALKDYYGMVHLLEEFPNIKLTFNLVPAMLAQIEDYLQGGRDVFQDIGAKEAAELSREEIHFISDHFFSLQHENHIKPYPRYDSLYQKRQQHSGDFQPNWESVFSVEELRDIQVWFQLTAIDEDYKANDQRVRALIQKGSRFSEKDKAILQEVEWKILQNVISEYKKFFDRGQIEISTSPFFHPILPLLINPQEGRLANPTLPPYDLDFSFVQDARSQLENALSFMETRFGRRPRGVWPSEGGLSEPVLRLLEQLGIGWTASDEINLGRSLGQPLERDGHFNIKNPDRLYRPYRLAGSNLDVFFRDRYLSDLIGFYYQRFSATDAARDLLARLHAIPADPDSSYTVTVILDGENAWEFYRHSGRDFLREFYRLVSGDERIETVLFSEARGSDAGLLKKFSSGSWINGNFDIWIGDPEDRKGWALLNEARNTLEAHRAQVGPDRFLQALNHIHIAEGSDWYWWFGRENYTPDLETFDRLFRANLEAVYRLLAVPVPEALSIPVADRQRVESLPVLPPLDYLSPEIDGRISDYFEWLSAGRIAIQSPSGVQHITQSIVKDIFFGFSEAVFFLRLDTVKEAISYFENGFRMELVFNPNGNPVTFNVMRSAETGLGRSGFRQGIGKIIELALPLSLIRATKADSLDFYLQWFFNGHSFQLIPRSGSIRITIPDHLFYLSFWQV